MEQTEQFIESNDSAMPSYWPSVVLAALIFSLITSVIQIILGYVQINSEPSGSIFSPSMFSGVIACLVGAFGGMLAVWHYSKENQLKMKLGKGALIGFMTGVVMVVLGILIQEIWHLIDPDFLDKVMKSSLANLEAMDIPEAQKQQAIDSAAQQFKSSQSITTRLLWGIPFLGVFNLLSGMLGVSLFARKKEEI